ncbi:MAG: hypothetical protein MUF59_07615 [Candidatus Krumholzibacteria bacterium]|jgi:hypothetical protein|nr:hypothetical protein [Candidatus Krumholzibacteria bacterium]
MMKERVDPAGFERFETCGIAIYVEKALLSAKSIRFTVASAGDFSLSLSG